MSAGFGKFVFCQHIAQLVDFIKLSLRKACTSGNVWSLSLLLLRPHCDRNASRLYTHFVQCTRGTDRNSPDKQRRVTRLKVCVGVTTAIRRALVIIYATAKHLANWHSRCIELYKAPMTSRVPNCCESAICGWCDAEAWFVVFKDKVSQE